MASGTDEKVKYVCTEVHPWDTCTDGSIGFMPVFDDVETLKEAYPDAEIMQITRMRD